LGSSGQQGDAAKAKASIAMACQDFIVRFCMGIGSL
jgi:hypothetical protein